MSGIVCDFCSSTRVRWAYPASDFHIDVVMPNGDVIAWGSREGWAACDGCHTLVESGQDETLARKSEDTCDLITVARMIGDRHFVDEMKRAIRRLHAEFRAHRTGPPVEIA